MAPTEADLLRLRSLEAEAEELLARIAASSEIASRQILERLEACAGTAAKIAFGTGNPELLSKQMSVLITWTDHLDDSLWVEEFQQALMRRPLLSPWKLRKL